MKSALAPRFELRQHQAEPRRVLATVQDVSSSAIRRDVDPAGGQGVVDIVVVKVRQPELLEVVDALRAAGGLPV
jgi:hypothetical protein